MKTMFWSLFLIITVQAFSLLSPTTAMAQNPTEYCGWVDASGWGKPINCQKPGISFGICGSGGNEDCTGLGGDKVSARSYCCRIPADSQPTAPKTLSGGYGKRLECPQNQVVTAYCGSGANADCPDKSYTQITCSTMEAVKLIPGQSAWYSTKEWGKDLACPNATILTGACGSGRNKDCPGGTTNQIKCTTYEIQN